LRKSSRLPSSGTPGTRGIDKVVGIVVVAMVAHDRMRAMARIHNARSSRVRQGNEAPVVRWVRLGVGRDAARDVVVEVARDAFR
jgi:hypothetical protein